MKKIIFTIATTALVAGCNTNPPDDAPAVRIDTLESIVHPRKDEKALRISGEDAIELVSQVKEIDKELKKVYSDTTTHSSLVLTQSATAEDASHYVDLMEMHDTHGVSIQKFRVDASTGEIKVLDIMNDKWITLEEWRNMKL